MVSKLLSKIFGSRNERLLKQMQRAVERINALEPQFVGLSEAELRAKTDEYRRRAADGESLIDLMPEAFATVREAAKRTLNMRHFDVQLIGGMVLNDGRISEMRTGEGKTLVATLPAYLNALAGRGVHVVTVNDYLARRDAKWMGRVYEFLGVSVGVIFAGQPPDEKREAYAADITYGTNNEYGFDYLRDNMAFTMADRVQRDLHYAIVDEVDSILIDEARTPLIISGPAEDSSELYRKVDSLVPKLERQADPEGPGDYSVDEKDRRVTLTEEGHQHAEELFFQEGLLEEGESLYDPKNINLMHHINVAVQAHTLYQRDVHYIVNNGQVIIVDEFTGRTMPGRRWSGGLHQAVEAKERVSIQNENQTLASITFQNYFRLYDKLSGMTGTADTEAYEFQQIYGLEVVVIPTHRSMVRDDQGDLVYRTAGEKYEAIVQDVKDCHERGQPVLVGTASIDVSEHLSELLTREKIKHQVLNAKQHEREAEIVAQAGQPGTVTIATNMAGRGTDIVLGGNLEAELAVLPPDDDQIHATAREEWQRRHDAVVGAGGLRVVGSERHESRRVDNQLRGRSGRQGDPGSSRFYVSLEDNLMRIFGSDRIATLMQRFKMPEGEALEHPWISRAIENAQRKVEGHNFDIRKNLLEFDDVANEQRKVIYEQRNELMAKDDISDVIKSIREDVIARAIDRFVPPQSLDEQWDIPGLEQALESDYGLKLDIRGWLDADENLHEEPLRDRVHEAVEQAYEEKEQLAGPAVMRHFEKAVMLQVLDSMWKEHLAAMDYLRQGIHLRGYAQKNPKQEYKREAFEMFTDLLERIKIEVVQILTRVQVRAEEDVEAVEEQRRPQPAAVQYEHAQSPALAAGADDEDFMASEEGAARPFVRDGRKVGRNEPCPCGSGKKFKHCHGQLA